MKNQEKPSPPSTRSSSQSLLQLALPHPLLTVLQLTLPPYPFFRPVKRADSATACPSSISSFFKSLKCANPTTADPSMSSDSVDDDLLSSSAHSAEDEEGLKCLLFLSLRRDII
ncbi:hypothetical protein E2C01_098965 [Portunus trituberculatus]|uniref:Uncharacterized protein n=1 Tax=Portunus trituberculatus TaxID=210409 RepID=A0A5B7K493_PORTR|nr:hypothetical protein [Portunus trituberculatus]